MLHWMLLTLSTMMPSLDVTIVGGCRLAGAISMNKAAVSHAFIDASVLTASHTSQMDGTRELAADGAPHHCAPAAAGAYRRWRAAPLRACSCGS